MFEKVVEDNRMLYKCKVKQDGTHYFKIKQAFEASHINRYCPNNDECCFAYTNDCELCPFFKN